MPRFFMIDGMSLVFRAYHAMYRTGLTNNSGEPTGAVFGFANILTSLLDKYDPKHILVVYDTSAPTFRNDMFEEYKANRAEFPEDLGPQLLKIKQMMNLFGIPQLELDGYEADDLIATLADKASEQEIDSYCLTSDKDYYQLVTDHIKILKPATKGGALEVIDYPEVREKFGVRPDQVIDVQALIGDSVDNIPGVKGIGIKTAYPLIEQFDSLEGLYENIDQVKSKSVKAKLIEHKEMAFLSKQLVTLKKDCPIEFKFDDYEFKNTKFEELDQFFAHEGFRTLRGKWFERSGKASLLNSTEFDKESDLENIESVDNDYKMINSKDELNNLIAEIEKHNILSVDLETSGLNKNECNIVGIALSFKEKTGFYIPIIDDEELREIKPENKSLFEQEEIDENQFNRKLRADKSLPVDYVIKKLKPVLESESIGKCGQNIKFDQYIMMRYGVQISPIIFDSMIASYVLNPDDKLNLDTLSEKWLGYKPVAINSLIGEKKKDQKSMADLNPEDIFGYACEDADLALRLKNILESKLKESGQEKLAYEIEFPTITVLNKMEMNGVSIDTDALEELQAEISKRIDTLEEQIYDEAEEQFNINSPKQLSEIMFEKMGIPPVKKTKTGYSTNEQVLNQLAPLHKIAEYVLDYRQLTKLQSTYVESLPNMVFEGTNKIHTTYNQAVASTGRLSSTDPNLQNIPIRSELGKKVRKAFIPSEGNILLAADYSQIELRIMAHICGDEKMLAGFINGDDIHAATASVLNDIPQEEVTQDMRRIAKTVNFGIMYGLGAFGLAERLGISRGEAKDIIDNYKEKYDGIIRYMEETVESARIKGYAETLCGRRRYFPNINSNNRMLKNADERAAINMPIQGTASDMLKIAMINIDKEMVSRKLKSKMILQVHDELVFDVEKSELEELRQMVIEKMSTALSLGDVPIVVDTGTGINWFEAH
ncbi:MAG: DNA polymerase I [Ignavibacteriae bacterium]|nr:DNA polymerase I [Ignavibacteriota bacterium]MCB9221793.1 DNA polymerase I [Ignavibacteria bacterium]